METPTQEIETSPTAADSADKGGDKAKRRKRSDAEVLEKSPKKTTHNVAATSDKSRSSSRPKYTPPPAAATLMPKERVEISVRSLLEAGVHFGHQTSRWNPAMAPYIYGVRNGIHIIHLPRTIQCWNKSRQAIIDLVSKGGKVLFVGTKKQAQESVVQEATKCGAFFVSKRWLGGMLTNFGTIRKSIERMKKVEEILATEEEAQRNGTPTKFTKKERLMYARELEKLNFSLGGIREMTSLPQLLFVVDVKREEIAIKEARRLDIPVVALVDTNCDPRNINHVIPSNDDGSRAVRLFSRAVSEAVIEGRIKYEENVRLGKVAATPVAAENHSRPVAEEAAPAEKAAETPATESGSATTES